MNLDQPDVPVNQTVADLMEKMIDFYGHNRVEVKDDVADLMTRIADLDHASLLQAFNALGEVTFDLAAEVGRYSGSIDDARPIIRHVVT